MKRTRFDGLIQSALVVAATAVIVSLNVVDVLDAARQGNPAEQWATQAQAAVDASIDAFASLVAR